MRKLLFVNGPNFSGRSSHLGAWLMTQRTVGPVVYVGPSVASALTGLAATVASELALYRAWNALEPPPTWLDYFTPKLNQPLASLSGGEQVLLALAGTARPGLRAIAIDCALEELDAEWRTWALGHLHDGPGSYEVRFADNRTLSARDRYDEVISMPAVCPSYPVHLEALRKEGAVCGLEASLVIEHLSFKYPHGPALFSDCSFSLEPGHVYHLRGPNGAGKSTLIRLLCGVLPFRTGTMYLNGCSYRPYREGNRVVSLSTQNPDDQWTDVSLASDWRRRVRSAGRSRGDLNPDDLLSRSAAMLGVHGLLDSHVLDLPRVLRKRISWLWPLSGLLPWLVFDEPTLGQDDDTVSHFAEALKLRASQGYGVIYVAHDHRLPLGLPSTAICIQKGKISICR